MDGMKNNSVDFPKFYHFILTLYIPNAFPVEDFSFLNSGPLSRHLTIVLIELYQSCFINLHCFVS